ncbi:Rab escort protein, putative [Candida dubliniensis CD36]|uniref:Rab proteins geranylgeranyltransferase component, putative n=1 Tax=Candida dubliniensis (strain CD36 / ATCC MYA-646 / CBS 7987 / NCPF 3949 / NRRL Y-17841) TaxID=573826 RepID=B9WEU3_CANDC|nr:Rab escort protein, putative [Candida dubliniensis CD36]CAX43205.1 Rab escort protein, putative [Candida dubliniensis CD36]
MNFSRTERRKSMAERRPSTVYTPPVIPHLAGLEKPQDQYLKMDNCDVLIIGTGLQESILAAALSWQGTQVLHIDNNTYYGDSCSTLTIEQLKKWCGDVNSGKIHHFQDAQIYIPGGKQSNQYTSKDYGIDLTPKIMFCQSDLLSLLIKSRVYRYLEFQSLSNFHVFENDDFQQKVNVTSKQDIFIDKSLSLLTKRYLMKFLKFLLLDSELDYKQRIKPYCRGGNGGGDNDNDTNDCSIQDFLRQEFKLQDPQINELVYSIGLSYKEQTSTKQALIRMKRFLSSFDIYGKFPCMISKFGGPGELSQGFCRSAAVAGTTYKLNTNLIDFDPISKIAHFDDGCHIKINEKIIISPTQLPKFLQSSYNKVIENLQPYYITRLVTVVRRDCKEWMSGNESSAIVVFPPHSLPTDNQYSVQVIIQNGKSGVCPDGQAIWFSSTVEQDLNRAKIDLESAFEKMETSLLRESSEEIVSDILDDNDFIMNNQTGTPILVNSFKLGSSLINFVPKEKLEIVCKLGYIEKTFINPDLSNIFKPTCENNIIYKDVKDANNEIIFTNMPSSELSYDGIITDVKSIYQRITGTIDDFFDVDFEDEEDEYDRNNQPMVQPKKNSVVGGIVGGGGGGGSSITNLTALREQHNEINHNDNAIDSDSDDDDDEEMHDMHDNEEDHGRGPEPFGADEMEL